MVPKAARNRFWGSKRRSRAERFFCPERFGRLFCSDRSVELSGKKICVTQPRKRKILSFPDVFGMTRWSKFDFLLGSTRQNALSTGARVFHRNRDNDLTLLGYLAASHMPVAAPSDRPEMCALGIPTACMNAATSSAKSSVE